MQDTVRMLVPGTFLVLSYLNVATFTYVKTVQEVTVEVKLKEDTKGKEVTLDIRPSSIKCVVKGETIFEVLTLQSCYKVKRIMQSPFYFRVLCLIR